MAASSPTTPISVWDEPGQQEQGGGHDLPAVADHLPVCRALYQLAAGLLLPLQPLLRGHEPGGKRDDGVAGISATPPSGSPPRSSPWHSQAGDELAEASQQVLLGTGRPQAAAERLEQGLKSWYAPSGQQAKAVDCQCTAPAASAASATAEVSATCTICGHLDGGDRVLCALPAPLRSPHRPLLDRRRTGALPASWRRRSPDGRPIRQREASASRFIDGEGSSGVVCHRQRLPMRATGDEAEGAIDPLGVIVLVGH